MKHCVLFAGTIIGLVISQCSWAWTKPTPQDIARLTAASENGDVKAMAELGDAYHFGFSVKADDKKAVEMWKKAAAQDYAFAEFRLGEIYGPDDKGNSVSVAISANGEQAIKWL